MADPFDGLVGRQQGATAPLGHESAGGVARTSSQPSWPGMVGAAPRWQQQHQQQYPLPSGVGVSATQGVVQHGSRAGETQNRRLRDGASSSSVASAQPAQQAPPGGGYAGYAAYPAHNQTPPAMAPWGGTISGTTSYSGGAPSYINTNTVATAAAVFHPALGYGGLQRNQQAASQQQQQQQQPGYYNPTINATAAFQGQGALLFAAARQPERNALTSPRADGLGSGGCGDGSVGSGGAEVAAGAEWTPPAEQLHVYEGMFGVASASSAVPGTVSGRAAVQFFSRSGLPKDSLKTVS